MRRQARPLLLLLLAGLMAVGCASSSTSLEGGPAPLQKVRFTEVIHSVFYAPQYVAQAKGFFQDEGIDLDTSTAQGSDKGVAALLAGTADIALVGPETTVFIYNQETPDKVQMFAQMTTTDGSFLLARQPASPFSWSQVSGKRIIGWRTGSMPQLIASAVLKQQHVTAEYITNLAAPAMAGAFESGQADYLQVFEPIASQLERAGTAHVVASIGQAYGKLPYTGYVATESYIRNHPELVQKYTNAVHRATRYLLQADLATVASEIAPYFVGTDAGLIEASLRRYKAQGSWKETPLMAPEDFERLQDLMVSGGVLDATKRAPFEKIVTNRFAEAATAQVR